jgi:hypothetical protein
MARMRHRIECECPAVDHLVRLSGIDVILPSEPGLRIRYTHCSNSVSCQQNRHHLDEIAGCLLLKYD